MGAMLFIGKGNQSLSRYRRNNLYSMKQANTQTSRALARLPYYDSPKMLPASACAILALIAAVMLFTACDKKNDKQQSLKGDVPITGVADEGASANSGIFAPADTMSTHCALPKIVADAPPGIDSGLAEMNIGVIKLDSEKIAISNTPTTIIEDDSTDIDERGDVWQAEFPGGIQAWVKFLRDNINSTVAANNNAPPGCYTIMFSFMIDKSGNVMNVKAETNPGYGMAEEVIRVIRLSAKWQPATNNARAVMYHQMQSITFQVTEE